MRSGDRPGLQNRRAASSMLPVCSTHTRFRQNKDFSACPAPLPCRCLRMFNADRGLRSFRFAFAAAFRRLRLLDPTLKRSILCNHFRRRPGRCFCLRCEFFSVFELLCGDTAEERLSGKGVKTLGRGNQLSRTHAVSEWRGVPGGRFDGSQHYLGSGRVGVEKKNRIRKGNGARQLGRQLTNLDPLDSIAGRRRNQAQRVMADAVIPAKCVPDGDTNNHRLAAAHFIE